MAWSLIVLLECPRLTYCCTHSNTFLLLNKWVKSSLWNNVAQVHVGTTEVVKKTSPLPRTEAAKILNQKHFISDSSILIFAFYSSL